MLKIQNLSKTYNNEVQALNNISLEIDHGIFGLLGPNGAGKSTLMRTLATLQDADSGSIELDGINLLKKPQLARQKLGYLPQDFGVYPNVSAEELLDQLAVFKGFTNTKTRRITVEYQLQLVNLYEKRKEKLGTFSGGMRQRFGIAQALFGDPKLVIVDEPTAGLDPAERIRFQNLLAQISEDRVLLLSTHIVEDVVGLCPQMAIMNQGKIISSGSPRSLINSLNGKIWTKVSEINSEKDESNGYQVISSRILQGELHLRVKSDRTPDDTFRSAEPNLNDVYFTALLN